MVLYVAHRTWSVSALSDPATSEGSWFKSNPRHQETNQAG